MTQSSQSVSVTFDANEDFLVAEHGNDRVQLCPVGKARDDLHYSCRNWRGPTELHRPTMVALTADGDHLIAKYATEFSSALHSEETAQRWQELVRLGCGISGVLWN